MDDLAQWLHARLDEDAEDARRGYLKAEPLADYNGWDKATTAGLPPIVAARVLREIEAKRQVIVAYTTAVARVEELAAISAGLRAKGQDAFMAEMDQGSAIQRRDVLYSVLCLFVSAYEDRPGYEESWRRIARS